MQVSLQTVVFRINRVVFSVKTFRNFHLEICYLKKKFLKKKTKLEGNLKREDVYVDNLKTLFSHDNLITDEKLFKATVGSRSWKFKVLYEYLDTGENCENIKYELYKDKER